VEILLARTNFQNKNLPTKFETPPETENEDPYCQKKKKRDK
jgi:hypothetical protein